MATSMTSPTHHFEQVSQLIENARSITDLNVIIKQLIPLSELKKILFDKLSTLQTKNQQNSNSKESDQLSLHSLYFNSYPFDEIFSTDIICSVIQYLAGSKMYHKLPQINTNFHKIMRENPVLYQQYKIQVTLSDAIWSNCTKKLFITISHQLQCIEISANLSQQFPYNAAIPLNSKIAPDQSHPHSPPQTNNFIIRSVQDMTSKCPFMWYAIRKWQIITHLSDYDHRDHGDHSTLLSVPPFINNTINTPSPSPSPAPHPDIDISNISSLMEQLLHKSSSYIRSLQIDERIMSASPSGGVFGMYGLYTRGASSNFYLNYNHELNDKKKHITSKVLNNLMSLNNLVHIEWITDESAPILKTLYFNKCNNNIVCLDLCGSQGYTILNGQILANLCKLTVLSIEFDDLRYVYNDEKEKEKKEKEKIVVKFPINIEFIELKNYDHASDIILDLSHCFNIIAMQLTISSKKYKFTNMLHTIKWPISITHNNNNNNNYLIQCLLIQFSRKSMSPSHDVWNGYIQALRNDENNKRLPVKCIQCITNTCSQPIYYKMGSFSYNLYNNDSNNMNNNNNNGNNTETVDNFTYTNLSVKGLGESNDNMNLSIKSKENITNMIRNNTDGDGILWKTLIDEKYKTIKDGDIIATDKILMYKKYFAMDLVKWIYHLGRDYGSSTSMDVFDTSSFNNFPDISTRLDRSTLSNNIIINPQYIQEQATVSSSFVVD